MSKLRLRKANNSPTSPRSNLNPGSGPTAASQIPAPAPSPSLCRVKWNLGHWQAILTDGRRQKDEGLGLLKTLRVQEGYLLEPKTQSHCVLGWLEE